MADDVVVMYLGRAVEEAPVDAVFHQPQHPYTKALLRSIPSIHAGHHTRLPIIAGSVPHPYERPNGCPFHPRCPDAIPGRCDAEAPEETRVRDGHRVRCHLMGMVPDDGSIDRGEVMT
jgi:peptide/nickel transport system ATP-binding protein